MLNNLVMDMDVSKLDCMILKFKHFSQKIFCNGLHNLMKFEDSIHECNNSRIIFFVLILILSIQ